MIGILTKEQLKKVAKKLNVDKDWHEPDNAGVEVKIYGKKFDNAGFWGIDHLRAVTKNPRIAKSDYEEWTEIFVVLYKDGKAIGEVNLATLFALATE